MDFDLAKAIAELAKNPPNEEIRREFTRQLFAPFQKPMSIVSPQPDSNTTGRVGD